jgi:hypothetical protein
VPGAWDEPGKSRLEPWWERQSLWVRGVLVALGFGALQFIWVLEGGFEWWERALLAAYVATYPAAYVRGKRHPRQVDPEKWLKMRTWGSWAVGIAIGTLLAILGALSGPQSLLIGLTSGISVGAASGWLVWTLSR